LVAYDLYVDAAHRKQVVGEALIKAAMDFARSENAVYVKLETAVDNYTAQKLYEAIGFEKQAPDSAYFAYRINVSR
jgi:ribosomal protein S18 acetylase RimI-like enzyme